MTTKINASVFGTITSGRVTDLIAADDAGTAGKVRFGNDSNVYITQDGSGNLVLNGLNLKVGASGGGAINGIASSADALKMGGDTGGNLVVNNNAVTDTGTPTVVLGSSDGLTYRKYSPSNFTVNKVANAISTSGYLSGSSYDGSAAQTWSVSAGAAATDVNKLAVRDASGDIYANLFRGTATSAYYADVAEKYLADAEYAPGTVVIFGGEKEITQSTIYGDRRVAGVISTNPAHLMNDGLEGGLPVALTGRVPCQVVGYVRKGDLMVTSNIPGVARADNDAKIGTVIGKALEDYHSTEVGVIEVVVGRV
jgi:hypothetical protein